MYACGGRSAAPGAGGEGPVCQPQTRNLCSRAAGMSSDTDAVAAQFKPCVVNELPWLGAAWQPRERSGLPSLFARSSGHVGHTQQHPDAGRAGAAGPAGFHTRRPFCRCAQVVPRRPRSSARARRRCGPAPTSQHQQYCEQVLTFAKEVRLACRMLQRAETSLSVRPPGRV